MEIYELRSKDSSGVSSCEAFRSRGTDTSPGVPDGRESDITIRAELQDAVLRLNPDPTELDVLRRVCAYTCVLLQDSVKKHFAHLV